METRTSLRSALNVTSERPPGLEDIGVLPHTHAKRDGEKKNNITERLHPSRRRNFLPPIRFENIDLLSLANPLLDRSIGATIDYHLKQQAY